MLMGAYDEGISIGQPRLWEESDLEAITIPGSEWDDQFGEYDYGLDEELGLVLADSEQFYRSVGLDGLGEMGDLAGFFSSIKKAVKKLTRPIQKRVAKDIKKIQKLRNKVTPKFLQKLEKKVLNKAISTQKKLFKLQTRLVPSFLRKPSRRLLSIVDKVQRKVTPPMVRKVLTDVAIVSPPGMAPGRQKFLAWLQMDNPDLFTAVTGTALTKQAKQVAKLPFLPGVPPGAQALVHGLGQAATTTTTAQPSIWDNIVSAAKTIIPAVVQAKAQRDLYKVQLQRAQQGQPPLKTEEIAPVIKTQVGVAPETMATMGAGLAKMAIPLAIGAGALILFLKK